MSSDIALPDKPPSGECKLIIDDEKGCKVKMTSYIGDAPYLKLEVSYEHTSDRHECANDCNGVHDVVTNIIAIGETNIVHQHRRLEIYYVGVDLRRDVTCYDDYLKYRSALEAIFDVLPREVLIGEHDINDLLTSKPSLAMTYFIEKFMYSGETRVLNPGYSYTDCSSMARSN